MISFTFCLQTRVPHFPAKGKENKKKRWLPRSNLSLNDLRAIKTKKFKTKPENMIPALTGIRCGLRDQGLPLLLLPLLPFLEQSSPTQRY